MTKAAKHMSERRCIYTREAAPRDGLIRFVVSPNGEVVPDLEEKLPGRGLWLTARADIVSVAVAENCFLKGCATKCLRNFDLAHRLESCYWTGAVWI